jgi:DNA-binding transcriptional LysR family regulator
MELRQLKYFVAVAEHQSISTAARTLYIAQPALTKQIHHLEEELGVTLLKRLPRGVTLTAAGQQFLNDAIKIQNDVLMARQNARQASNGQIGTLSLGLTITYQLLPEVATALRQFRENAPEVSVSLAQILSGPQVDRIRTGELDAGFLFFRPVDDPTLTGMLIAKQRLVLAMPTEPRWTDHPPRKLADLNGRDFIWFPRSATPLYHDHLIACFRQAGFLPHVVMEGTDNNSLLTLVTAGMGCAILPERVKTHATPDVTFIDLEDLDLDMPLELVWRVDNESPVLHRFLDVVSGILAAGSATAGCAAAGGAAAQQRDEQ